ncbi:hypothetical protein [Micromonospora carbonacea]|uniref:Uncharacterized protein n=1 Tax=Micromonospora carbonacea TaxID=47853 RepID=A0A1C4WWI8_9ACTN|nr:hypothetical protein [Micromonospora carbonacea]SCF00606.1 hypothetical protein GA0070563_10483 [Micromonospora carbonacea]
MSGVDLDAIEALVNAATDGPWTAHDDGLVWAERPGDPVSGSVQQADADFIAAARSAVSAMAAEIRQLRAALAAATPQILTTEPGPEVTAVWDSDGDKWIRHPDGGWQRDKLAGRVATWGQISIWAPITATPPAAGR